MSSDHPSRPSTQPELGLRYRMPAPARTVWLGLGWPALSGLATTASLTVLLAVTGKLGFAVLTGLVGTTLSLAPAQGRPLLEWVAPAASHLRRLACGTDRFIQPPTSVPSGAPVRLAPGLSPRPLRLLPLEGALHEPLGVLQHGRGPDRTVVLDVISTGRFGLLDPTAQDSEIARWSSTLTSLLSDPAVRTVQWLTHTRPDTRDVQTPTTASHGTGREHGPSNTELAADYADLVSNVRGQTVQHRHLLALTVRAPLPEGAEGAGTLGITRAAATALLSADLIARPLSPGGLGTTLRLLLDPTLQDRGAQADPGTWSHLSARDQWTHCLTDDTVHRAFAVAGWPRLALNADWLAPLLHDPPLPGTARTLSMHVRPVAATVAARRARAVAAKAHLDDTDRTRLGFTPIAADSLTAQDAAATEAELLAGYRMTDLSALLVLAAPDLRALDEACRQLLATAATQHLDLRVLHGQHRQALAGALPFALHPGGLT